MPFQQKNDALARPDDPSLPTLNLPWFRKRQSILTRILVANKPKYLRNRWYGSSAGPPSICLAELMVGTPPVWEINGNLDSQASREGTGSSRSRTMEFAHAPIRHVGAAKRKWDPAADPDLRTAARQSVLGLPLAKPDSSNVPALHSFHFWLQGLPPFS